MANLSPVQLIEQVSSDLVNLTESDLILVATFVDYLKQQPTVSASPMSASALLREVQRRAAALAHVPRATIVTHFQQVAEEIRQQAIMKGTAIVGDWEHD